MLIRRNLGYLKLIFLIKVKTITINKFFNKFIYFVSFLSVKIAIIDKQEALQVCQVVDTFVVQ